MIARVAATAHARLRLLVAVSQALALGTLAAAAMPLFLGAPAPLGETMLLVTASVGLGFALGHWPHGAQVPATEARLRAGFGLLVWAAATSGLLAAGQPTPLALVWGVFGFTAVLAAQGAAQVESEDGARSLAVRSFLAAAAACVLGAIFSHSLLPATSALALVALLVAATVHAIARAHFNAVDADRVSRHAGAAVGAVALLAILLAIGPVHDAVVVALGYLWFGLSYAFAGAAIIASYALYALYRLLLLFIHPHAHQTTGPARAGGKTPHLHASPHASPVLVHFGPLLALLAAAAVAVWLAGRIRRGHPDADPGLYRDEILAPDAVTRRRGRRRPVGPPTNPLARAYAQALGVLVTARDERAHPLASDTPAMIARRAATVLRTEDDEALALFERLTAAYVLWRYGGRDSDMPDGAAGIAARLRRALPALTARTRPARAVAGRPAHDPRP